MGERERERAGQRTEAVHAGQSKKDPGPKRTEKEGGNDRETEVNRGAEAWWILVAEREISSQKILVAEIKISSQKILVAEIKISS
jgi:hypothetical protein